MMKLCSIPLPPPPKKQKKPLLVLFPFPLPLSLKQYMQQSSLLLNPSLSSNTCVQLKSSLQTWPIFQRMHYGPTFQMLPNGPTMNTYNTTEKVKKDVNSIGTSKTYKHLILSRQHPNSIQPKLCTPSIRDKYGLVSFTTRKQTNKS